MITNMEGIMLPMMTFVSGSFMIYYNQNDAMYLTFGVLQIVATMFYMYANAVNVVYSVINSVYL